jgi:predicted nuclease of predicted toxin-antitoxin system
MARLYADEQFPFPVVAILRNFGHDALTIQEAGNAGDDDPEVLAFAVNNDRTVMTQNRRHFIRLHAEPPNHYGIIVCTDDKNLERLATRINDAIAGEETLRGKLIRVNRPPQ